MSAADGSSGQGSSWSLMRSGNSGTTRGRERASKPFATLTRTIVTANLALANIYERLSRRRPAQLLTDSDHAIERVLASREANLYPSASRPWR